MAGNKTLAIIKPDAFNSGKGGQIIAHLLHDVGQVHADVARTSGRSGGTSKNDWSH